MSMHEIEAVVEMSIRCLDQSPEAEKLDLRSIFWNLYEFQACWDTGMTYFRVMEILLKYHFLYFIGVKDHPDYAAYKDYFDNLSNDGYVIPDDEQDNDNNPAYFIDGKIYLTAGSELWHKLAAEKALIGVDAVYPQTMDLDEIVRLILVEAEKKNDTELIFYWYSILVLNHIGDENKLEELQHNPVLGEIGDIIYRTGAYRIEDNYGLLRHPDEEAKKEIPVLAWWFDEWMDERGSR